MLSNSDAGEDSWKSFRLQGDQTWISFEGLMLKLQYFGYQMRRADLLEKTSMLGKVEGKRRK